MEGVGDAEESIVARKGRRGGALGGGEGAAGVWRLENGAGAKGMWGVVVGKGLGALSSAVLKTTGLDVIRRRLQPKNIMLGVKEWGGAHHSLPTTPCPPLFAHHSLPITPCSHLPSRARCLPMQSSATW